MSIPPQVDTSFVYNEDALKSAVELLGKFFYVNEKTPFDLPAILPELGVGESDTLNRLAPLVIGGAAKLASENAFSHMDPPTPWISWATSMWNAALNQNLLHPATAPVARQVEETVVNWLAPFFGMRGGQMVPGSTLANITALWAAREVKGAKRVVASSQSHISIRKAAHLLGMEYVPVDSDAHHHIRGDILGDLEGSVLVLTAGTTSIGAIDHLKLRGNAAWVHVDAAWAGPLMLSEKHKNKLSGIENADSIAISAHKWLFQPKESALVLFKDWKSALPAISFGGAYLAVPNVGVLGSHGAAAVSLLATLLAWGRSGIEQRIDRCMQHAQSLTNHIKNDGRFTLYSEPESGVVVWRPENCKIEDKLELLTGMVSTTKIDEQVWLRSVAANPNANVDKIFKRICEIFY